MCSGETQVFVSYVPAVATRGRVWRLPVTEPHATERRRLLALLGLGESAVIQVPESDDPRRTTVTLELTTEERQWLDNASRALGLSAGATASRIVRSVVRSLIRHRDLLPVTVPFDASSQPWLEEAEATLSSLAERLRPWADALPEQTVRALIELLHDSLEARKR